MSAEINAASAAETRVCQNCKTQFTIEPEDFSFYEHIKVPPPTFCPDCRMQRRLTWRNERTLYKRTCDLCKQQIVSMYPEHSSFTVYCPECWQSDKWDSASYGKPYDFSIPFFTQFRALLGAVPRLSLEGYQNVNTPYSNYTWFSKDIYLSPTTISSENIGNSFSIWFSTDSFDCDHLNNSNHCNDVVNGERCAKCAASLNIQECLDSRFLYDCRDTQHSFLSANLRHASNVLRNRRYSAEEYRVELQKIDTGSFRVWEELQREFEAMRNAAITRFAVTLKSVNVNGQAIVYSKNIHHSFNISHSENLRYSAQALYGKDCMDVYGLGGGPEGASDLVYEGVNVGYKDSQLLFSVDTFEGMIDAQYCDLCKGSQDVFGCIGMRGKKYCILNRQYNKEEYAALLQKILEQMRTVPYVDAQGREYRYGEFFPAEISPFAYNESIAQEHFPLNKKQVVASGYRWRDAETTSYTITIPAQKLPDHIAETPESILNEVIGCAHEENCFEQCTKAFRIIASELHFYRHENLPLPRLCPNCRHYVRIRKRTPMKLWHRSCMCEKAHPQHSGRCPNEFETSYAPDHPEIVYCEQCYQAEVV
ncbi:MAG: hypothetical protein V1489_01055 [Candidatus Liptonbacteria bacterium]